MAKPIRVAAPRLKNARALLLAHYRGQVESGKSHAFMQYVRKLAELESGEPVRLYLDGRYPGPFSGLISPGPRRWYEIGRDGVLRPAKAPAVTTIHAQSHQKEA